MSPRKWTIQELRVLAEGVAQGKSYRRIWEESFKGSRTYDAVRSAARTEKYAEVAAEIEDPGGVFLPDDDVSVFRFPGIDLELNAETFASLVRDYVSSGGDLTRAQVAQKYGLKESDVDHICRTYGLTKDNPPFPRELTAQTDDDEIIELALSAREAGIKQKVADSRAKFFERKYRKLLKRHQNREAVLARVDEFLRGRAQFGAQMVSKAHISAKARIVHAPTADIHAGKQSWAPEVDGHHYDTEISARFLRDHGIWVAARIEDRFEGGVGTVYVTDVGDFFHAILSETESGTALDKDTRDMKVFDLMFDAKVQQIDQIRQVAEEVIVIAVPGNHDHIFQTLFNRMLRLHYADAPDVEVKDVYGPFSGFVVGKTAHLLDHGKGVNSLSGWKAKATSRTVERIVFGPDHEYRPHRIYYCGHLHSLQIAEFTGMELRRLRPLGESDDYETSLRYGSLPGAELFFLRKDGMIEAIERFYPRRVRG